MKKHLFLILALAVQAANTTDTAYTVRNINRNGGESNLIARPLTSLPRPAYVATSESAAIGVSVLSWKMKHSGKSWQRKVWLLPQAATLAGNTVGAVYSARHQ